MPVQRIVAGVLLTAGLMFPAMAVAQDDGGARGRRERQANARADERGDERADQARGNGARRGRGAAARFRGMDADHDGVITRAEWRGNDESFRQHDTNHDGVLSGDEVTALEDAAATPRRRDDLVAAFTRADRDNDGRLGRHEWTPTLGSFDAADANHDGIVTRAEYLAANRMAGRLPPDAAGRAAADTRRDSRAYRAGFDKGVADGRQAGREDRQVNGGRWDLEGQRELEQADAGYDQVLGPREEYQAGYRAGFRRGYGEGFGPR